MILDTNALSALADGDEQLEPVLHCASEIVLPVIVLGEYRYGIRQSRNYKRYEQWLSELMASSRILHIDGRTAEYYAELRDGLKRVGKPIPGNDLWIAALVLQYSMPLLSRDRHFDVVPNLKRISW